ncbi:MAG: GNAT family N-acetyltransferase [Dehalococcoidia bacterium]|nr:MAG: GNAT family N-acetyltransferase [Dehalococcoidia bacterium]
MSYSIFVEDIDSLVERWQTIGDSFGHVPFFVLPNWLKAWWSIFGTSSNLLLQIVKQNDNTIGISPLRFAQGAASFIGDAAVCDYLDFIIIQGKEKDFFTVLMNQLKANGIGALSLEALRPDSTVLQHLIPLAKDQRYHVSCQQQNVSVHMQIPETWSKYLSLLSSKQRHEIKRKIKRLYELGEVKFYTTNSYQEASEGLTRFISMFRASRQDKALFMDARMQAFFKRLVELMAGDGLIKFGFLELNRLPVAVVVYFDYHDNIYLYNSGYNPDYRQDSVGILSKVLCIKEGIAQNKKLFDFLQGPEIYKYRLGGTEIPLYKCNVAF